MKIPSWLWSVGSAIFKYLSDWLGGKGNQTAAQDAQNQQNQVATDTENKIQEGQNNVNNNPSHVETDDGGISFNGYRKP
jgi:hypothetical protein